MMMMMMMMIDDSPDADASCAEFADYDFCALYIVYNTKGTVCLNLKYEAEPDRQRFQYSDNK